MHDLQLSCEMLAIDLVLRRHMDVDRCDLVVVWKSVLANVCDVPELLGLRLQIVASVRHTDARHWLPAAPVQEAVVSHLGHIGRHDVDGRLPGTVAANAVVRLPAIGVGVVPSFHTTVAVRGGVHSVLGQAGHPLVFHGRLDRHRHQGRVHTRDRQGEEVELLQVDLKGRLEHHPPHAPARTGGRHGAAAVPEPIAREHIRQARGDVDGLVGYVRTAIPDGLLVHLLAKTEVPQERALRAQLEGHADHYPVEMVVLAQAPVVSRCMSSRCRWRRRSDGVAEQHMLDHELTVVADAIDGVCRNWLDRNLLRHESPAIHVHVAEVAMPIGHMCVKGVHRRRDADLAAGLVVHLVILGSSHLWVGAVEIHGRLRALLGLLPALRAFPRGANSLHGLAAGGRVAPADLKLVDGYCPAFPLLHGPLVHVPGVFLEHLGQLLDLHRLDGLHGAEHKPVHRLGAGRHRHAAVVEVGVPTKSGSDSLMEVDAHRCRPLALGQEVALVEAHLLKHRAAEAGILRDLEQGAHHKSLLQRIGIALRFVNDHHLGIVMGAVDGMKARSREVDLGGLVDDRLALEVDELQGSKGSINMGRAHVLADLDHGVL
mmetsp:Transcript_45797/g.97814  ORF Transcript_45797/g.97814 Transcript_45797/m.97814 type:complete len:599 (+) Transcript_45797:759-2555(+)